MNRRLLAILGLVGLVAVLVLAMGCSRSTKSNSTGTSSTTISEKNSAFSPSTLTVNVGDTVTFKNDDSVTHEVSIDNKSLGQQSPGQSVTWNASKAGSYPFKCLIHPSMTGQITVGAGSGSNTPATGTGGGSGSSGYGY